MDLGERIKKIRLQYKFTQQEVADLCGFTKGLLSLYFDSLQAHGIEVINEEARYLNFLI
jgi:transcriptional regulator with XRE-family HTH domain